MELYSIYYVFILKNKPDFLTYVQMEQPLESLAMIMTCVIEKMSNAVVSLAIEAQQH